MDSKFKPFIIAAVILVLGVGGVVAYLSTQSSSDNKIGTKSTQSQGQSQTSKTSDSGAVEATEVEIKDFHFTPAAIKVKVGTKVTWTNQDSIKHTVTSEDGAPDKMDSELLGKGETYSFTFKKAGTYAYYCQPHTYMKGTITVTE